MIRGPVAQVVLRFAVVPADEVEFLAPAARRRGQYGNGLYDLIFDLGHGLSPRAMGLPGVKSIPFFLLYSQ